MFKPGGCMSWCSCASIKEDDNDSLKSAVNDVNNDDVSNIHDANNEKNVESNVQEETNNKDEVWDIQDSNNYEDVGNTVQKHHQVN